MTYDLALQLKNAGFPFKSYEWAPEFYGLYSYVSKDEETLKVPLLEELIEACGGFKFKLVRGQVGWFAETKGVFSAGSQTPTEAVARLWLALHTK